MRRALGSVLALLLLATGCSLTGGPKPDSAADALARALSHQQLNGTRFVGATGSHAQSQLHHVLAGMAPWKPRVTATNVSADGDAADADLVWRWNTPGKAWTYRTPVTLAKRGDRWVPTWRTALIYPELAKDGRLRATGLLATRGDVLGAHGARIVTLRLVDRIGIDKTLVAPAVAATSAPALAKLVGIDPADYAKRVAAASDRAFVEAITFRRNAADEPDQAAVQAIAGARKIAARQPLAPTKQFASGLLGSVGRPTAEMIKKSGGTLSATQPIGINGLQARYDDQLRGTDGVKVESLDAQGKPTQVFRTEPTAGKPLQTTLDVNAQTLAEQVLAGQASASALVALRPSTGDVLAAASNAAAGGQNIATFGRYAPGSTFKIVSSLALLRAGVTPNTAVDCPATLDVNGKQFKNYSDYPSSALGRIPFREAIANSCNTAVIGLRDKLSGSDLTDAAAALGLGEDHDVGFPAYFGQAPAAGSDTEAAADMIGQGKVLASPMTMATVAASVQKGSVVVPHLIATKTASASPAHPLTSTEAAQLRTLMRGVVTQGSGRLLQDLPGAPVLAKTGTAEYGTAQPLKTHAWMVAIHGDLAVAVFVEDGATGSGTAGPLLKRFLMGY